MVHNQVAYTKQKLKKTKVYDIIICDIWTPYLKEESTRTLCLDSCDKLFPCWVVQISSCCLYYCSIIFA